MSDGDLVNAQDRAAVWEEEVPVGMARDSVCVCLMQLDYMLKNAENGKFYVCSTIILKNGAIFKNQIYCFCNFKKKEEEESQHAVFPRKQKLEGVMSNRVHMILAKQKTRKSGWEEISRESLQRTSVF